MKNSHLFWGGLFISLGILILINNYGTLNLAWTEIWKLWPLVFILWGIIIIVKNPLTKNLLSIATAIVLALAIFASFKSLFLWVGDDINIVVNDADTDFETSTYSNDFTTGIENAEFNFDAGAGTFIIKGSTDKLFSAVTEGYSNNYDYTSETVDNNAVIEFNMKNTKFSLGKGKIRNRVKMEFNQSPVWDMNFDVGAASINFDLSEYRTRNISLNMGASSLNLRIGNMYNDTRISIDAGASSINVDIPETSGCEIKSDVSLSSKKYRGFKETSEGLYRTENFEEAENRIYINISTGISSIQVDRY